MMFVRTVQKKSVHSHVLVLLQLAAVVLSCYPVGWRNYGSTWFLVLCLLGTGLGIVVLYYNRLSNFSVYPEVRLGARLITGGPYRYVRHPMYTALIIMMAGVAGYNGHWLNAVGAVCVVLVVVRKAFMEERFLSAVFPEYDAYVSRTTRFVPYVL